MRPDNTSNLPVAGTPEILAGWIAKAAEGKDRFIIAVAGPPGSGKSTLAEAIVPHLDRPACIVPMDGFHLDNEVLVARGLLHRKGAPETFDVTGFAQLVDALRDGSARYYPTFDRDADRVIPDGAPLPNDAEILIVEGNYLLFSDHGWHAVAEKWDASVWIEVPESTLEERLINRWLRHGLSTDDARQRARENDMVNGRRAAKGSGRPTWILSPERV